jgi:hypothetical protein
MYPSFQENYKTAFPIPPLQEHLPVNHSNLCSSLSKLSLVAPAPRKSPTTNMTAEGDSAKAGVEGISVVQPSEEHLTILRLKNLFSTHSDQTALQVSPMLILYSYVI